MSTQKAPVLEHRGFSIPLLTSDKAICEMNTGELAEEYEYCMKSAESEALAPDLQRYFRDRAAAVKKYLDEIRK